MKVKVYKYLGFSEGSLCVLKEQTLKFSCYSEFNDPFDCIAEYDVEASLNNFRNRTDLIKEVALAKGLSPAKRLQNKKIFEADIRRIIESGSLHMSVVEKVGILCLSHKDDNILMWSHYADHHKGFVVEFDIDIGAAKFGDKLVDWTLVGYDVIYSETMPILCAAAEENDFNAIKDMFLTKSKDWEYESEYRVLTINKGPGIHKFNGTLISRVIAGAKISDENYEILVSLVKKLSIKYGKEIILDRAKMVKGEYKIKTT